MVHLIYSPRWFCNYDALFDLIGAFVLLVIAFYTFKLYRYSKEKRHFYFTLSLISISLSFLAKVLTNFTLYGTKEITRQIGLVVINYHTKIPIIAFFTVGFFFFRLLFLAGIFGMLMILLNPNPKRAMIIMFLYFIIITTVFSWSAYFVFHITSAMILVFLVKGYMDYYKKKKNPKIRLLAVSFFLIFLSQILFIFALLNGTTYVAGEILQLIGFIVLGYDYYSIMHKSGQSNKKGKKESKKTTKKTKK